MSNKAQALAILQDSKLPFAEISAIAEICRRHLEEIRKAEKMTAQRAIVLGVMLWKVRLALPHGDWMPWQAQYLSACKTEVNYYMRLALVFLIKSRATKVELRALPSDSVELAANDALSRALLTRLEKFVGECSLHELLVKHGLKGVTRDQGDEDGADASAKTGEQLVFTSFCDTLFAVRQTVLKREHLMQLTPDQLKGFRREWEQTNSEMQALFAEALGQK